LQPAVVNRNNTITLNEDAQVLQNEGITIDEGTVNMINLVQKLKYNE
jgi:hypothetical protein